MYEGMDLDITALNLNCMAFCVGKLNGILCWQIAWHSVLAN